jgi:hypothetical protein
MAEETTVEETEETTESETDDPARGGGEDKEKDAEYWRGQLREYERNAKKASAATKKELDELRKKLSEKEKEDLSEQERAIEEAREKARNEVLSEVEKERRADRLDAAVTRLAATGITIGEGDKARTVKFLDPEDALARIERGLARGDIDPDDVYDSDNRVKAEGIESILGGFATKNSHLVGEAAAAKRTGDADSRKGDVADKELEDITPEQHAERKYGGKK